MQRAVFGGTFDPITLGHLDIIKKTSCIFSDILIAVADGNNGKTTTFGINDRVDFVRGATSDIKGVEVKRFDGMLVDFAQENSCNYIIRGIRNTLDFEYEKTLYHIYKLQNPKIEIVYFMCDQLLSHISSSIVKTFLDAGHNIDKLIPTSIIQNVHTRFKK